MSHLTTASPRTSTNTSIYDTTAWLRTSSNASSQNRPDPKHARLPPDVAYREDFREMM